MKKLILALGVLIGFSITGNSQIYMGKAGKASFSSHAPLEDIYAESNVCTAAINTKSNDISVKLKITTLKMENSLQQEHLNEKYLESHKFPYASFKGKIEGDIDWTKDGVYDVKVNGNLLVHGIGRARTLDAKITIEKGQISAKAAFDITVKDHEVEIPKLVFQKVAEVVQVEIDIPLEPYQKK